MTDSCLIIEKRNAAARVATAIFSRYNSALSVCRTIMILLYYYNYNIAANVGLNTQDHNAVTILIQSR